MKILVDKMPVSPDDCPFSKADTMHGLVVCSLKMMVPGGRKAHCVCKPAYCPHLKEVTCIAQTLK